MSLYRMSLLEASWAEADSVKFTKVTEIRCFAMRDLIGEMRLDDRDVERNGCCYQGY